MTAGLSPQEGIVLQTQGGKARLPQSKKFYFILGSLHFRWPGFMLGFFPFDSGYHSSGVNCSSDPLPGLLKGTHSGLRLLSDHLSLRAQTHIHVPVPPGQRFRSAIHCAHPSRFDLSPAPEIHSLPGTMTSSPGTNLCYN